MWTESSIPEAERHLAQRRVALFELLVHMTLVHVALGLTAALTYVFLVRAALVPSRPLWTFLLTALIGYPAAVFMGTGVLPFQKGWLVPISETS